MAEAGATKAQQTERVGVLELFLNVGGSIASPLMRRLFDPLFDPFDETARRNLERRHRLREAELAVETIDEALRRRERQSAQPGVVDKDLVVRTNELERHGAAMALRAVTNAAAAEVELGGDIMKVVEVVEHAPVNVLRISGISGDLKEQAAGIMGQL